MALYMKYLTELFNVLNRTFSSSIIALLALEW